ncbi:hypothetical protein MYX75_07670 [Acidobacteria bacterium AH-259-A15]|nr:hypothetical protein [Acidobacteria bacterium AH-259-A15]
MIPKYLRPFFWDINLENFDPASYPEYTLYRLLEYGDDKAVVWLRETFSEAKIKEVIRTEGRLSRRSANFWALVYAVPFGEVAALKTTGSASVTPS